MRINDRKLKALYKQKGLHLKDLLKISGLSKTAYYNILYKQKLLPGSVYDLAEALDVTPSAFLEEMSQDEIKIIKVIQLTDKIMKEHPSLDRDNVRHTLILLNKKPIERLKRGLLRGRNSYSYQ